jgi:hypothetical protein
MGGRRVEIGGILADLKRSDQGERPSSVTAATIAAHDGSVGVDHLSQDFKGLTAIAAEVLVEWHHFSLMGTILAESGWRCQGRWMGAAT